METFSWYYYDQLRHTYLVSYSSLSCLSTLISSNILSLLRASLSGCSSAAAAASAADSSAEPADFNAVDADFSVEASCLPDS